MVQIDVESATIEALQRALGESVAAHIRKGSTIKSFAKDAGVPRATLYRLLKGDTVGSDVLLRIFRTLNRTDLLRQLVSPPEDSPIEKWNRRNMGKTQMTAAESVPLLSKLKTAEKKEKPLNG